MFKFLCGVFNLLAWPARLNPYLCSYIVVVGSAPPCCIWAACCLWAHYLPTPANPGLLAHLTFFYAMVPFLSPSLGGGYVIGNFGPRSPSPFWLGAPPACTAPWCHCSSARWHHLAAPLTRHADAHVVVTHVARGLWPLQLPPSLACWV